MSARSGYEFANGAHGGELGRFILRSRAEGRSVRWIQLHLNHEFGIQVASATAHRWITKAEKSEALVEALTATRGERQTRLAKRGQQR